MHKSAEEILTTLGFTRKGVIRGWVLMRTAGFENEAPVRMHAIVHKDDDGVFIDIHADHQGPNDTHITSRGRRVQRWNSIFEQIDHHLPCDAGYKLLGHYNALREALETYHEER